MKQTQSEHLKITRRSPNNHIVEVARRKGQIQHTFRKLASGFQYGGELDQTDSGNNGILISYKDQYYLQECEVRNSFLIGYKSKYNLISSEKILQNEKDIRDNTKTLKVQSLCHELYRKYINERNECQIIVFFTNQTDQFLDKSKTKDDYRRFSSSYSKFVQIFIHIKQDMSFAFVIIQKELNFIISQNNVKSNGALQEILQHLKNNSEYNIQRFEYRINKRKLENENLEFNQYFVIPLLYMCFSRSKLTKKDFQQVQSLTHQLYYSQNYFIYDAVTYMLKQKPMVIQFSQLFNRKYKQITTFQGWQNKKC